MYSKQSLAILDVIDTEEVKRQIVTAPIDLSDGSFHHLVVTRSAGTISVYIDNTLVAQQYISNKPLELDSDNLLGASHFDSEIPFNGQMKKFGFYTYCLSGTEIGDLYNAP